MIILPRQARDKHRENSKRDTRFLIGWAGDQSYLPAGQGGTAPPGQRTGARRLMNECDSVPSASVGIMKMRKLNLLSRSQRSPVVGAPIPNIGALSGRYAPAFGGAYQG